VATTFVDISSPRLITEVWLALAGNLLQLSVEVLKNAQDLYSNSSGVLKAVGGIAN
jgi:hypothetical protein